MLGALLSRELTLSLRRGGFHVLLTVQTLFALVLAFGLERGVRLLTPAIPRSLGTTTTASLTGPAAIFASSVETTLLLAWGGWLVFACALAVPALAGASIARERERGTLSVLLGAGARPAALVAVKLGTVILLTAGLLASGLPALGLALMFGSPRLESIAAAGLILLVWGCLIASLTLVCSALANTASAGVAGALIASNLLLSLTVILPVGATALGATLPGLAYRLNPLFAMLLTEPEVGRRLVEQLASGPWLDAFAADPGLPGPAWLPFVVLALALAAILGGATSLVLSKRPTDG